MAWRAGNGLLICMRLQQHQRQPQREDHGHDDHAHEAHRAKGLALNVGDAEEEADAGVHARRSGRGSWPSFEGSGELLESASSWSL